MKHPANAKQTSISAAMNSSAVTPDNVAEIAEFVPKGIWVGTGGTIVGQLHGDTADITFTNVQNGTFLPFAFRLIKPSSSASGIVAVW